MPGKCNCNYPEEKYDTWTGHSHNCPIEKAAREGTYPRSKGESKPPDNLPKWLQKRLRR